MSINDINNTYTAEEAAAVFLINPPHHVEPNTYTAEEAAAIGMRFNDLDGDGLTTMSESKWYLSAEEYQAYLKSAIDSVAAGWEEKNAEAKNAAVLEPIADIVEGDNSLLAQK